MMKNILIASAILIALIIAYKFGTRGGVSNQSNEQLESRALQAERNLEIQKLSEEYRSISEAVRTIEEQIERDERRIFKRISRTELVNASVQLTEYRRRLREIDQRLRVLKTGY